MTKDPKTQGSVTLKTMTSAGAKKMMAELADVHEVADEASTEVARSYSAIKKRGINLDALRWARKLYTLDNPAKVQSVLGDFDRLRELLGLDAQQPLFEDDKTKPQKEASNVVPISGIGSGAVQQPAAEQVGEKAPGPAAKPARVKRGAKPTASAAPPPKKALFDESDDDGQSAIEKARQDGIVAGGAGEDYENPYPKDQAELHGAWHDGWVKGSEDAAAGATAEQQSA